jgi:pimeloyl-ACP methyl ester carboxylesterase
MKHPFFLFGGKMKVQIVSVIGLLLYFSAPVRAAALDWKELEKVEQGIVGTSEWDVAGDALDRWSWQIATQARAEQERRWGLFLPGKIDEGKPLVILVHGMDGDRGSCADLAALLTRDGVQTGFFCYPGDQGLRRSAELLTRNLLAVRETFPQLKVDLVTESMGGLIARDYIEGDRYAGGVDRLIMICPPNGGSKWAALSPISKLAANEWRWQHDPDWNVVWMIGEGLCQAGCDVSPDSRFLGELNEKERRPGVKYTIVAGNEPVGDRVAADLLDAGGSALPVATGEMWPTKEMGELAHGWAAALRWKIGKSDGPVALKSAMLSGVEDVVLLHADHLALYESIDGREPAAWAAVRQRVEGADGK